MNEQEIFSDTFFAMGTRCDVVFTNIEQEFAEQMFQLVKNEVDQLEHQLSRFIYDSPLSILNETKAGEWVEVGDELWDILTICYDFHQMSNGAFDITLAPLINLWKDNNSPSDEEIQKAKRVSGFDKVEFDFEKRKIKFRVEELQFDLGAIGKGIALDTLKPLLQKQGINNGIISFGESSILALGKHPGGDNWPLGIRNNYRIHEFVHVFHSSDNVVTTSGSILASDEGTLKTRNHIISPVSGLAIEGNRTISIKSDSATIGEFLSTALLILPENDKNILVEKFKNIEILEVEYVENDFKTKLTIV